MSKIDNITNGMMSHFRVAREFEFYEQAHLSTTEVSKEYLGHQSKKCRKTLSDIQEIILPSVKESIRRVKYNTVTYTLQNCQFAERCLL